MSEAMIEYTMSEDGNAVFARWNWPAGDTRPGGLLCAKNSDSTKVNPLFGRTVYVDVRFKSGVFTGTDVTPRKQLVDYLKSDWIPSELRPGHPDGYCICSEAFDTLSKRIDAPVKADIEYTMSEDGTTFYADWQWPKYDERKNGILCATYRPVNPLYDRHVCVDVSLDGLDNSPIDVDQIAKCLVTHPDIPPELRLATPEGIPSLIGAFNTLAQRVESKPEDDHSDWEAVTDGSMGITPAGTGMFTLGKSFEQMVEEDQARWTSVIEGAFSVEPEVVEIEMKDPPPPWRGYEGIQGGDNCRCTAPTPTPDLSRYNTTCPCGAPAYQGLDEFRLECSRGCKR